MWELIRANKRHSIVLILLMAVVLLGFFESDPGQWEAIRWLNSSPSPQGESFRDYLKKWRDAVPETHRAFVEGIAGLYGVEME